MSDVMARSLAAFVATVGYFQLFDGRGDIWMSAVFLLGLAVVAFLPETEGKPPPE